MDFVRIANFNNKLTAETTAHVLDQAGIPFTIHSDDVLFGEGGISDYVFLSVPGDREAEAREMIAGLNPDGPSA